MALCDVTDSKEAMLGVGTLNVTCLWIEKDLQFSHIFNVMERILIQSLWRSHEGASGTLSALVWKLTICLPLCRNWRPELKSHSTGRFET